MLIYQKKNLVLGPLLPYNIRMDGHIDSSADKPKPKTHEVVHWASDETKMASDCPLTKCCGDKTAVHYTRTDCPLDKCGEKITIPEPHDVDEKCSDKTYHIVRTEHPLDKHTDEKAHHVVHTEYPVHCKTLDPSALHCEEATCNLNRDPHCSGAIATTTCDLEHRDNCKPTDNVHGCGKPEMLSKLPPCHMAAKKCHRGDMDHRECSFDRDEYRACDEFDIKEDEEPGCKDISSGHNSSDPNAKDVGDGGL
ncbi:hypothetical protein B0T22DRAFT_275319 [Podospora appendiculata]|uniref:Uncharacterized protein n=1 Tax=Podospora appendiculata TaxID=314037 RepID=A0AAE0X017_9PEZI|nr:hypothetical protein B0T22DRAFT_275319 [Podospora appendiculata]